MNLGTFVVIGNLNSTGIPSSIWNKVAGKTPFKTIRSIVGLTFLVLLTSQVLGNVAIVVMAKPNIVSLPAAQKELAWAIVGFVATVGGNLTITGSIANIILAEKVARIDPVNSIDFFRHVRVCFLITLFSTVAGTLIIVLLSLLLDSQLGL